MADQFTIDISRWTKKVEDNLDKFMLEFTQDLAEEVIKNTPVDTGFLRASWTANIGSPDISTTGEETGGNASAAIAVSLNRVNKKLLNVKGGDTVYYTNNARYAARIEYGFKGADSLGRNYNQEGQGFVREVVTRAGTIARDAARRVNK